MTQTDDLTRIAEAARDWRRDLHQMPELLYALPKTSAYVAEKLRGFGVDELVTGLADTGMCR